MAGTDPKPQADAVPPSMEGKTDDGQAARPPGSQGTAQTPAPETVPEASGQRVKVSPDRRAHILEGDATGGGHRHGGGSPGKSEFPSDWSDDKIIEEVENVANDPASRRTVQPNGRIRVEGTRDGVDIRVIIDADGTSIRTAHPINR
jgi:hypothetical protein